MFKKPAHEPRDSSSTRRADTASPSVRTTASTLPEDHQLPPPGLGHPDPVRRKKDAHAIAKARETKEAHHTTALSPHSDAGRRDKGDADRDTGGVVRRSRSSPPPLPVRGGARSSRRSKHIEPSPSPDGGNVIESDDAGAGPLDPDDSMYQGRSSRSRTSKGREKVQTREKGEPKASRGRTTASRKLSGRSPSPPVTSRGKARNSPTTTPLRENYVDTEAVESDEDRPELPDDEEEEPDYDSYDYSDSFIDDSPVPEKPHSSRHKSKRKRKDSPSRSQSPPLEHARKKARTHGSKDRSPVLSNSKDRRVVKKKPSTRGRVSHTESNRESQQSDSPTVRRPESTERHKKHANASRRVVTPESDSANTGDEASLHSEHSNERQARTTRTKARDAGISPQQESKTGTVAHSSAGASGSTGHKRELTMAELAARHMLAAGTSAGASKPASTRKGDPAPPGYVRRCARCPDKCEVTDPALWDPLLAAVYPSLPPLKQGAAVPWSSVAGPGQVSFMAWSKQAPSMPARLALDAVNYVGENSMIRNPSRAPPQDIILRTVGGASGRFNLYLDTKPPRPLIAYSAGYLEHSQLLSTEGSPLAHRYIRMIFHTQEWERFLGFITTATGFPSLHAQLGQDALQFSTRPQPSSDPKGKGKAKSDMFKSPSKSRGSVNNMGAETSFSLPNDVPIPVYDAREAPPTFNLERDITRIGEIVPLLEGEEIPVGSLVGVGYTMSVYRSAVGNMTLGCNIQWVILFGSPEGDTDEESENSNRDTGMADEDDD